ncbi:hypothetical protein FHX08_001231 [Rhizobium sp. BK529]|uniref:hypothetical protein n=1 Tax=unclassified Rhizobium TaxID=2613769 RepID=UPI001052AD47|nr:MULTISPECIES: hypothetical protein [unclassified Rhizobium]MBB3590887.1 hypothetical protein [Rhizobium sp. BK529]TCS09159.1 hypothetical protein EV281_1011040 [Rhizobium sp. BK418]
MVRDISRENIRYKLGLISISVDDLIKLLESKGVKNATAKTDTVEFDSLDDIKTNKALLAGQPRIYLEEAIISFERGWGAVSPRGDQPNGSSFAKSVFEELIMYKSPLDRFSESRIFGWTYVLIFIAFGWFWKPIAAKLDIGDNVNYTLDIIFMGYFAMFVTKHLWAGYSAFFRKVVYYRPVDGFFRRNIETIAVSAITGLVGLAVGAVGSGFIDKIKGLF